MKDNIEVGDIVKYLPNKESNWVGIVKNLKKFFKIPNITRTKKLHISLLYI